MAAQTVVIADDHPLFRSALAQALRKMLPDAELREVADFASLRALVADEAGIDLVLLDLQMPGAQGFSSLLFLRSEHPDIPVVIVSGREEPELMRRALDFGAAGYIPKSCSFEQMSEGLREVLAGDIWTPPQLAEAPPSTDTDRELAQRIASLSPQQYRVFMMLADGRLNKQIAFELGVMEATVKAHMTAILNKLGFVRRTQAALLAQRLLQTEAMPLAVPDTGDDGVD
ncbi:response regulator transcription factor [Sinimarinibacterium thermocellulolyticum]|uniref:Response regulator transcription factor n=1 Tax=Sinimarinibacterium thermocellulolyticum TaxID=3170016 RepID=A0ABV2AD73_9GAMM